MRLASSISFDIMLPPEQSEMLFSGEFQWWSFGPSAMIL
ncbi:MAG: hypothetical protein ACJA13_001403, partial [Paraglaciecola sp.]